MNPTEEPTWTMTTIVTDDMRDDFAMSALTGILAKEGPNEFTPDFVATRAYEMADAMLRARATQKE